MKTCAFGISLFSILFVAALGQASPKLSSQAPVVSLCTLLATPKQFADKEVTVKATLASNSEYQSLKDNSCPAVVNQTSGRTDIVEVTFNEGDNTAPSEANKRLNRLLKKDGEARVTLAGMFVDPGQYIGHQSCCRYQLRVQKVLKVESAAQSKHDK